MKTWSGDVRQEVKLFRRLNPRGESRKEVDFLTNVPVRIEAREFSKRLGVLTHAQLHSYLLAQFHPKTLDCGNQGLFELALRFYR